MMGGTRGVINDFQDETRTRGETGGGGDGGGGGKKPAPRTGDETGEYRSAIARSRPQKRLFGSSFRRFDVPRDCRDKRRFCHVNKRIPGAGIRSKFRSAHRPRASFEIIWWCSQCQSGISVSPRSVAATSRRRELWKVPMDFPRIRPSAVSSTDEFPGFAPRKGSIYSRIALYPVPGVTIPWLPRLHV